jgi:hypothetical protein
MAIFFRLWKQLVWCGRAVFQISTEMNIPKPPNFKFEKYLRFRVGLNSLRCGTPLFKPKIHDYSQSQQAQSGKRLIWAFEQNI